MLTDIQYALKQLRAIPVSPTAIRTNDHVQRAIDALERVEEHLVAKERDEALEAGAKAAVVRLATRI